MTATEFIEEAYNIIDDAEHFRLNAERFDNVAEIQLWMTDPWGQDSIVFSASNNGDEVTDRLILSDLKRRFEICDNHIKTHYDYERRIVVQTA